MGMSRSIAVSGTGPGWAELHSALVGLGLPPAVRMIDSLPAFPDEIPEETWRELRLGFATGMVTLRRQPGEWTCTIWGNADAELTRAWEACCTVIAEKK